MVKQRSVYWNSQRDTRSVRDTATGDRVGNELAPGDPTMQKGARVFIVYDVEDAGPWLYGFSQGKFGYFHSSLVKSCGDPPVRKIHEVDELKRPVSFK